MRKPFVMGNWKLNGSKEMAAELVAGLKKATNGIHNCDIAIAPPAVYIDYIASLTQGSSIKLGAQDSSIHEFGAFTGETSPLMLKELGVTHVIIGHSERRTYHHESNEIVAQKFEAVKKAGLIPVLCIGETEAENEKGLTETVCAAQIDAVLALVGVDAFMNAVIAYEPVWAIGTGKSATPAQAQAVHHFIRSHIAKACTKVADQLIIQYGGSVNDKNAAELFTQPDIDGALVGGASLKLDAFTAIIKAAADAKKA